MDSKEKSLRSWVFPFFGVMIALGTVLGGMWHSHPLIGVFLGLLAGIFCGGAVLFIVDALLGLTEPRNEEN